MALPPKGISLAVGPKQVTNESVKFPMASRKNQVTQAATGNQAPQGEAAGTASGGDAPGVVVVSMPAERLVTPKGTASGIPVWCGFDAVESRRALKPNPRNPNKHPEAQVLLFVKILKANGWRRPIVVSRRSGFVTKGHGALLAAEAGKLEMVPVTYQDYPSDAAELEDLVADNELARLAVTEESTLREILKDLQTAGEDLELTGILKKLEDKPTLKEIELKAPPAMAWILVGVPLVKFAKVNAVIEGLAKDPDVFCETCVSDVKAEETVK